MPNATSSTPELLSNALACACSKLVESPPCFRHADNRYVESVSFDQSLKRWKDLFVRKIPSRAEEDNRIRIDMSTHLIDHDRTLTSCVTQAVDSLRVDGTLAKLQDQWLAQAGAPVLS